MCTWPHFESNGFGSRKSGLLQCTVVNKLAGQGLLYIRIKQAYNFVLHESDAGQDHSGWLDQDYLSLTGQLKDPPVPLHVMIRQGSSLVQVQVPVPTKRKSRQFLPLILKRRFPKVRTGLPDHGCTAHFKNEIGFSQECLLKNNFVRAYYLAFDWSGWVAFVKIRRECPGRSVLTNGKRPKRWVLDMQNREEGQWVLLEHAPWFKISLTAC